MAFIAEQDEELQNQGQQVPLVGGASANVTGGPSNTGVGKGGQGGFVNLQSYLNANQGAGQGSAQRLNDSVKGVFDQESQNIKSQAGSYLNNAEKQVKDSSMTTEQADESLNQAGQDYDWGGLQKLGYQQNVDKVRGALNNQYSGPREYTYGIGAQAQEYGNNLKDDRSFNQFMGSIYNQAAGGQMSQGQRALQNQLDVNNVDLANARQGALQRYGQLESERDQTVQDTTNKLSGLEQGYRTNQNKLRDYLTGRITGLETGIAQQESDARKAYQDTFTKDTTGLKSIPWDWAQQSPQFAAEMQGFGYYSPNMTWQNMQNEQDRLFFNNYNQALAQGGHAYYTNGDNRPIEEKERRRGVLNEFYGQQDEKYGMTADEDERRYNALLDFLGSTGERKKKGFQVRE